MRFQFVNCSFHDKNIQKLGYIRDLFTWLLNFFQGAVSFVVILCQKVQFRMLYLDVAQFGKLFYPSNMHRLFKMHRHMFRTKLFSVHIYSLACVWKYISNNNHFNICFSFTTFLLSPSWFNWTRGLKSVKHSHGARVHLNIFDWYKIALLIIYPCVIRYA